MLTKFRHLNELLFRFNDDGDLQGVHAIYLEGIAENGVRIQAQPGTAIPLSLVDAADRPTVAAALGDAMSAVVTAKETAEAAYAAKCAECDALDMEVAAKDANIQTLLAKVADLEAKLA